MKGKENNINYTAEDIQQYLSGKLTPLQMNAMEKATLDNPFLAEAIEGYEGMPLVEWQNELNSLKENFENANSKAKVIALPKRNNWFKYAAAVLLIGSTTAISYWIINKKDKQQQIAQNLKTVSSPDSITVTAANTETRRAASAKEDLKTAENKTTTATTNFATVTEQIKPDSNFVYRPAVQPPAKVEGEKVMDDIATEKSKSNPTVANAAPSPTYNNTSNNERLNNSNNKSAANQAESDKFYERKDIAKQGLPNKKEQQQLNRNFIAQVVGPDNTPLPFANVNIKSENFGTYADVKGNFRLVSSDSLLTVEIKSVGYQPKFYTLKSNVEQNKIVLAEDEMAFKQKTVVSGNAAGKSVTLKRAVLLKDSVVNAEPADGWDNYNTYADNNLEIPDDILNKNIHGQVGLSFDVKANGKISNIKVDKSLCDNCDEAAKRLLEQGPQWKVKKGKKGKAKVTVQF